MRFWLLIILILLISGCNQDKIATLEKITRELAEENQRLNEEATIKNDFIREYTNTVNAVYENLEKIRKREGFIAKLSKDIEKQRKTTVKTLMLSDINSIDGYIKQSKKRIRQLKTKLSAAEVETEALTEMIDHLSDTIDAKEAEVLLLKEEMTVLNERVSEAEKDLKLKNEVIIQQAETLNTAYYIIDSEKSLKEKGIIIDKGGFLGLRKTRQLTDDFETAHFHVTNISVTERIPLSTNIEQIQIISPHDPASYQLVEQDEDMGALEILNPAEFWKMRYLVIVEKS